MLKRPKKLVRGDTVRVIAPASPFERQKFNAGVGRLREFGFEVEFAEDIYSEADYLAGSDKRRLDELHAAFRDPKCRAIFCARGGYGCTRLLSQLNLALIRKNPKILVGFSDITALLATLVFQCKMTAVHGPLVASQFAEESVSAESATQLKHLMMESRSHELKLDGAMVREGTCEGMLFGGNLMVLQSLVGLKMFPKFSGMILFIEEVNEKPYRIDRMLTHLAALGCFKKLAGVIVGQLGTQDAAWE